MVRPQGVEFVALCAALLSQLFLYTSARLWLTARFCAAVGPQIRITSAACCSGLAGTTELRNPHGLKFLRVFICLGGGCGWTETSQTRQPRAAWGGAALMQMTWARGSAWGFLGEAKVAGCGSDLDLSMLGLNSCVFCKSWALCEQLRNSREFRCLDVPVLALLFFWGYI